MNLQQNQYFKYFMSACKHCQPIIINTLLKLKQIYLSEEIACIDISPLSARVQGDNKIKRIIRHSA